MAICTVRVTEFTTCLLLITKNPCVTFLVVDSLSVDYEPLAEARELKFGVLNEDGCPIIRPQLLQIASSIDCIRLEVHRVEVIGLHLDECFVLARHKVAEFAPADGQGWRLPDCSVQIVERV